MDNIEMRHKKSVRLILVSTTGKTGKQVKKNSTLKAFKNICMTIVRQKEELIEISNILVNLGNYLPMPLA